MKASVTLLAGILALGLAGAAMADTVPQSLPLTQNWTNTGLITANDNWSAVPGITGYLAVNNTIGTGVNPKSLVGDSMNVVDDIANQSNPNTLTNGGVAEFDGIPNPVVALQGSGTANAPGLIFYISTTLKQSINFSCNLRDIDGSADNAAQQIAVQFRVGASGTWTNVAGGYVADATTGPSLATLVTPLSLTLPNSADNQSQVQIRVITTNAVGNDEWVGIDDISITGQPFVVPVEPSTWSKIKSGLNQ